MRNLTYLFFKLVLFVSTILSGWIIVGSNRNVLAAEPTDVPRFVRKWGSTGTGNNQLYNPHGVVADNADNTYIVDAVNCRIKKINSLYSFVIDIGTGCSSAAGKFGAYPQSSLDITSFGNIAVADTANNRVLIFSTSGDYLSGFGSAGSADGQFSSPRGLAVDNDGNIYVVERSNYRVQKFDQNFNFITKWGSVGSENGFFDRPQDIAISGNYVFVADTFNDRVQKFNTNGEFISSFLINRPRGIGIDRNNNVYVTSLDQYVQIFSISGESLGSFGSSGTGDGQFNGPQDVAFNSRKQVIVSDQVNNRIQVFAYPELLVTESAETTLVNELSSDTFEIVLNAPPTDDVTVSLSAPAPLLGSGVMLSPSSLIFTASNWETPQTVTVTGIADNVRSGDRTVTISHSVTSADTGYDGLTAPSVTVTLSEFDTTPPSLTLTSPPSISGSTSMSLTGTASDTLSNIVSVEYSLDNGTTWLECSASDGVFDSHEEDFLCGITNLSDGSVTPLVRATDQAGNRSDGTSVGSTTIDTTPPKKDFSSIDPLTGQEFIKAFKQTNLNNMNVVGDTHMPTFCFTRAYDEGVGLSHYTVVVNGNDYLSNIPYVQPPVGDNGDTRADGDSVIKENNQWYFQYHLYDDVTKQQEICAYGKSDSHYLDTGIHSWSVKAVDKVGNSISTDTNKFLVMTNTGTYQKPHQSVWFPLSLLQVGNRINLNNYSTTTPELFTKDTKPLLFSDSTPTIYGIAPVGATINLTLEKESTDEAGNTSRQQVISQSTTSNSSSEWGINLDTTLSTGLYYLTIQSSDSQDNFAILKDIPIQLSNSTVTTSSPVE